MGGAKKIASQPYVGPSIIKEILYGLSIGLFAGGLWKMHHWNNHKRTKEFYDLLDEGAISVVHDDKCPGFPCTCK